MALGLSMALLSGCGSSDDIVDNIVDNTVPNNLSAKFLCFVNSFNFYFCKNKKIIWFNRDFKLYKINKN